MPNNAYTSRDVYILSFIALGIGLAGGFVILSAYLNAHPY